MKQYVSLMLLMVSLSLLQGCKFWQSEESLPVQEEQVIVADIEQPAEKTMRTEGGIRAISSQEEFNDALKQGKPTFAKFFAEWCPPCKASKPMVEEAAAKYGDQVNFIELDSDTMALRPLVVKYAQEGLPSFVFFDKEGKKVDSRAGAYRSQDELNKAIEELAKK